MLSADSEAPTPTIDEQLANDGDQAQRNASERNRILDAAEKAIAVHRHGDPGVHDILREAGVSGRTLYAHFASKDELYVGLIRRDFDVEIATMTGRLGQTNDPRTRIEIWIDAYLDWHFHAGQLSNRSVLIAGPVTRASGYLEAVKDCRRQIALVLAESITRATVAGQATSTNPMLDAVSMRAIIDGVCEELETSAPMTDRADAKAHVKRFAWAALGLTDRA